MNFHWPEIAAPLAPRGDIFGRLHQIRLAWKLSATEVSKRIGVRKETLRRWELGATTPSLFQLMRWCKVLGYELSIWPLERRA